MASKRRIQDVDGEEGPSLGFGYSKPAEKKVFSGGESSGSSLNFIQFTKAGTNHDGSKNEDTTNKYGSEKASGSKLTDISKLEVVGDIHPAIVEDAAVFLERFHCNLKRAMNDPKNGNNSMTTNFNNCSQSLKQNPTYLYEDLKNIDMNAIPPGFKTHFFAKDGGFLCEVKIKDVFFSIGCAGSKSGARDRAIEQAMRVLDIAEVAVDVRPRKWKDKAYPQLVLININVPRRIMPQYFVAPEGTKEHAIAQYNHQKQKESKCRFTKEQQAVLKNPNIHHMGPPTSISGIGYENFIIMHKSGENTMSKLNTSAQFCKMSIDFYFEEIESGRANDNKSGNYVVTLFIEGQPVADARGVKKNIKYEVAERALEFLTKVCYSVIFNNRDGKVDKQNIVTRKEVKKISEYVKEEEKIGEDSIGNKMLQNMGWKEGASLGAKGSSGIVDIVELPESSNREGFKEKSLNSNAIQAKEAEGIIKKYAASDDMTDLVFSHTLTFDERKEVAATAKKFGLNCRKVVENDNGWKNTFLVINKKVGPQFIIEQLEREGSWGKYQLVMPTGGDMDTVNMYLTHQHLRKTQGFPEELQMLANAPNKPSAGGWFDTTGTGESKKFSPSTPTASKSGPPNLMSLQPRLSTFTGPGPKPLLSLNLSGPSSRSFEPWSNSNVDSNSSMSDDQKWENLKWDGGAQFKRKLYKGIGLDVKKGMEEYEGEDGGEEGNQDFSGWSQGSAFDLRQNSGYGESGRGSWSHFSGRGGPSSFNNMGGRFGQIGANPDPHLLNEQIQQLQRKVRELQSGRGGFNQRGSQQKMMMMEQIENLQQTVKDLQSKRLGSFGSSNDNIGGFRNFHNMNNAGSSFGNFNNMNMDGGGANRQASGGQFWKNMRGNSYQGNRRRF